MQYNRNGYDKQNCEKSKEGSNRNSNFKNANMANSNVVSTTLLNLSKENLMLLPKKKDLSSKSGTHIFGPIFNHYIFVLYQKGIKIKLVKVGQHSW